MAVNTLDETYVSKLVVQNKHVFVKLLWKPNEIDLFHTQIFDGDCCWSGRFSNESAQAFRDRDNIDENEARYSLNVKNCLTGEDENYIFDLTTAEEDANKASFSWKRRFRTVNVLHGKVPVQRDLNPQLKDELVDILLKKNCDLGNNVKELQTKTMKLETELKECKDELEKYVNMKASLESTLYSKFLHLLNAKKKRIQLLEDNLLNFEEPNITMVDEID